MEKELMKEAMHDACIRAVTEISADVKALVQAALDRETNETAEEYAFFHAGESGYRKSTGQGSLPVPWISDHLDFLRR